MNGIQEGIWNLYTAVAPMVRGVDRETVSSPSFPTVTWTSSEVRQHLLDEVVPFWERHAIDEQAGGYWSELGTSGRRSGTSKPTVAHARMMYSFAVAWSLSADERHLAAAEHGARFLLEQAWDPTHGGWFRSLDRYGTVVDDGKYVVDQAYATALLSEYARLTGNEECHELARTTYELLERAWDPRFGGYFEAARRDWTVNDERKSSCVQLDMLFASMLVHRISGDPEVLDRVGSLARILTDRIHEPRSGALLEWYACDWRYRPWTTRDSLSVGHPLKAVWELLEASDVTGDAKSVEVAYDIYRWCVEHSWDDVSGTFVSEVYRNGRTARRERSWWAQCEGMLALVALHRRTGSDEHLHLLHRLLTGTVRTFADDVDLGWWGWRDPYSPPTDLRKAWAWKAGYHVAQSLSVVSAHLSRDVELA